MKLSRAFCNSGLTSGDEEMLLVCEAPAVKINLATELLTPFQRSEHTIHVCRLESTAITSCRRVNGGCAICTV